MKYSFVVAAFAVSGLVLAGSSPAQAQGQLNRVDQNCRTTIAKGLTKLAKTADKIIVGCHKKRNIGKVDGSIDCNDLAQADTKGKMGRAAAKLKGGIAKKCTAAGANFGNDFVSCPEPCGTTTGVANPLTSFLDLGTCLACYGGRAIESLDAVNLGAPGPPLGKGDAKCHAAIGKGYGKYTATILKERTKCQKAADREVGDGDTTGCSTDDPKLKINKALIKAKAGVDKFCTGDLTNVASCNAASLVDLKLCLESNADASAAALFAANYELDPTICPAGMAMTIRAGTRPGGETTASQLKEGFTGVAHDKDLPDGFGLDVSIDCGAGSTPPCGDCTITGVDPSATSYTVRCADDSSISCSPAFGTDTACPGLQECTVYLGPPWPISMVNIPFCEVSRLRQDLSGTVDIEIGSAELALELNKKVHMGVLIFQPCPICVGDTTPNDGRADGTCQDGSNDGGSCDTNAVDATFGDMSLDCPPSPSTNISGNGSRIDLDLTTGVTSMPFGAKCAPFDFLDCACAVCTGDQTLPCNSDAECAAVGAGTCASSGNSALTLPNSCEDGVCIPDGSGHGVCLSGGPQFDPFCDGVLKANGGGLLFCSSDANCRIFDSFCPGGNCGNCAFHESLRSCFLDPIVATGSVDPENPVFVDTFCVPPVFTDLGNGLIGLPGPAVIAMDMLTEFNY